MAEQNERVNGEREERSDAEETLETVLADLLLLLLFELIEDVLRGERATWRAIGKVLRLIRSVTEDVIIVRLVGVVGIVDVVGVVIVGVHFAHVVIATSGAADVVIVVATSGGGADVVAILVTAVATATNVAIAIAITAVLVFQYLVHLGIASSVAPVHCLVREGIIALLFRRHALGRKHVTHEEEGAKTILNRWKHKEENI